MIDMDIDDWYEHGWLVWTWLIDINMDDGI